MGKCTNNIQTIDEKKCEIIKKEQTKNYKIINSTKKMYAYMKLKPNENNLTHTSCEKLS